MAKKKRPVVKWVFDATFFAAVVYVNARTAAEARKKALAKLRKKSLTGLINKKATFLDKI
jgi:hypothetical protein